MGTSGSSMQVILNPVGVLHNYTYSTKLVSQYVLIDWVEFIIPSTHYVTKVHPVLRPC